MVSCALFALAPTSAQENAPVDTGDRYSGKALLTNGGEENARRIDWWLDARFGMFIHWGLYSQDGCFWRGQDGKTEHMMRHLQIPLKQYATLADVFNPVKFDAENWVLLAKNSGMKYIVYTAKHHDGFAMYNSPGSGFNITRKTPFKRDPVKELAEACRKHGMRLGLYYSLGRDWEDPDASTENGRRSNTWDFPDEAKKDFSKYMERKVKPQVRELLTQYGPVAVIWFDTPENISPAHSKELIRLIRSLQPDCIINSRVGNRLGDYKVIEQEIPKNSDVQPWESCMTINNHWGYHKTDAKWKATEKLIRNLIDIAGKGGNFLLNVGPTGEGIIPQPSVDRLAELGAWMRVNGESIYGTKASPLQVQVWGRCTTKDKEGKGRIYLHVFDWPQDGKLNVLGLQSKVSSASLLATGEGLRFATTSGGVEIEVPEKAPDSISSTIVLTLSGL